MLLLTAARAQCCAGFGQGSGPILVDDLDCYGSEYRLSDCQYHNNTDDDTHYEDWGVICYTGILLHTSIHVLHTACVTTSIQTRTIIFFLLWGLCVKLQLPLFVLILDGPESGDVRLTHTYYGSVQVFLSGSWVFITTTHYPWTVENAQVVCRELGYLTTGTCYILRVYIIYDIIQVIVTWVCKIVRTVCQCKGSDFLYNSYMYEVTHN